MVKTKQHKNEYRIMGKTLQVGEIYTHDSGQSINITITDDEISGGFVPMDQTGRIARENFKALRPILTALSAEGIVCQNRIQDEKLIGVEVNITTSMTTHRRLPNIPTAATIIDKIHAALALAEKASSRVAQHATAPLPG